MTRRTRYPYLAAALSLILLAAGCSSKATDDTGTATDGGIKTGPGVTADTITVGALTDLSGVFGAQGKIIVQGNQLYIDQINAAGGICGRKLAMLTKDHGTNVQNAVSAYAELEPQVLGFVQILGSPITTALGTDLAADKALSVATAWAASLLKNPSMVVIGNTYDVETINGIDYLAKAKGLRAGDVVGHIHFEGDFGSNALQGATYAAGKLGLKLESLQIKSTDVDLTAQVTTLKARGAKAIVLSAGPRQTASVAGVASSVGLDVPLLANTPGFDPSLLDTPVRDALQKNLIVLSSYAPYATSAPGPESVAQMQPRTYPDAKPNGSAGLGYVSAYVFGEILKKACANKDLSRDGVLAAYRQLTAVDTRGFTAVLDYSQPGKAPSRQTYVQKVDAAVPGGLTVLQGPSESETAAGYSALPA